MLVIKPKVVMYNSISSSIQNRKGQGFTLVELLIVIVIAGILATLAVPSYQTFVAGQRIKTASFDIMSMLILARSEAIKRNALVTASPTNNNWAQGWTVSTSGVPNLSQQDALPGITVTCSPSCNDLTYELSGRVSAASVQTIQIGSSVATEAGARCIGIDLSGRPYSKKGGC